MLENSATNTCHSFAHPRSPPRTERGRPSRALVVGMMIPRFPATEETLITPNVQDSAHSCGPYDILSKAISRKVS